MSETRKRDAVLAMRPHEFAVERQLTTQVIPPDTCPIIDKIVKAVRSAEKVADNWRRDDAVTDLQNALGDIGWKLGGLETQIETVREHNATLRQLGKAWYALADEGLAIITEQGERLAAVEAERDALRRMVEAAIERVRAACENELRWIDAQPILRALEETP